MAKRRPSGPKHHRFRNKLLLNQWLVSLFGIDPLQEHTLRGKPVRPFHILAEPISDPRMEGLDHDNLHNFYHNLVNSNIFWNDTCALSREQILLYEENIVRHTQAINQHRYRPITWKYNQWLTLLFCEIYLDRYFHDPETLLADLNAFVDRFNGHWTDYADVPPYEQDDLNKLCIQNATGSGKTLLMHINLLQFRHYAAKTGRAKELSRAILLTPNERLTEQHLADFAQSRIEAADFATEGFNLFTQARHLDRVDILEITKLADQEGPNTVATRSLGAQNLLLVDEGHRGMSGKEEGAWFTRRAALCEKGFTFEYSATFEQAVSAANNASFENSYAKTVMFDYSYRWFYEDGFGKDYQILNLPASFQETQTIYMTACLLKFYQQLRIYQDRHADLSEFNLEKPLWVFVGSTVLKAKGGTQDETVVAADVAQIIQFVADFLAAQTASTRRIHELLTGSGRDTGLLDAHGNDIFSGAFTYLLRAMNAGETADSIYADILRRVFNNPAGGHLVLARIKGESGEVALKAGAADDPFGLINVGNAKGLCDHIEEVAAHHNTQVEVVDSDFTEAMFASVKDSNSPVNLLIGSKKFVEGWDCWRVSTLGLMHVGRTEGTQIIQLFGRGVRLKGHAWSLKRSGHSFAPRRPLFIEEIETLNVFGIEADFMAKFRDFLKEEGLPGNERRQVFTIPLNVTDLGNRLKILRPKRKAADGKEYSFKKDAPVPSVGAIPSYMTHNTVVSDWYPRIKAVQSRNIGQAAGKDRVQLRDKHLALLNYDDLFFELERFKRDRAWYNLNISKGGIRRLLADPSWYTLYMPAARLEPAGYDGVLLLQQVAAELLRGYCKHYYNYRKREYIEPRLELRELTPDDDNIPKDDQYQLVVDGDEDQLIQAIHQIKRELQDGRDKFLQVGDLFACNFRQHLYQPLFHVRRGGKIAILPVALNHSEYQFVTDLKQWCDANAGQLAAKKAELFLLRNMTRGQGIGFFEAEGFHPDFILWLLLPGKQYVTFVEPHGLIHDGPASEKVRFHERIKDIETRLGDPHVVLNSFIISWTPHPQLQWGLSREELARIHVLFMNEDRDTYIDTLVASICDGANAQRAPSLDTNT